MIVFFLISQNSSMGKPISLFHLLYPPPPLPFNFKKLKLIGTIHKAYLFTVLLNLAYIFLYPVVFKICWCCVRSGDVTWTRPKTNRQ